MGFANDAKRYGSARHTEARRDFIGGPAGAAEIAAPVALVPGWREEVERSAHAIREQLEAGAVMYGINTGFGLLANTRIGSDRLEALQLSIVLAIEWLAAVQGIDFRRPLKSSETVEAAHALLRTQVARWDCDRYVAPDIEARVLVSLPHLLSSVPAGLVTSYG